MVTRAWMFFLFLLSVAQGWSQCTTIFDGTGNASNNPYFVGCSGADFTVFIQPNGALGAYTIDWGDGSPLASGTGLVAPNFITHTYASAVDTFNLVITDLSNGCIVNGVVVIEEPVNASIQIPLGGVTQTCAPAFIDFVNSSTDVSPTTVFTWTFGDGSPPLVFGPGNAGDTIAHQYLRNTVNCNTVVTLEAENYCSFGNPTTAQFSPIQIYDLDDAQINASAQTLCYPDTTITFTNATNKNCVPQGNVQQRYEYWNFGDHWGLGYDSIIDWQPFDPPARPGHTIAFPGIGTYSIMMIDSNMCGQDTAYITVQIVPAPIANITANKDTICAGEQVVFGNSSVGNPTLYAWNFDKGVGWQNFNGTNKARTYPNAGTYNVGLAVDYAGGSPACKDTAYVPVVVEPSPIADFLVSPAVGCDSIEVSITDNSQNVAQWNWNFGNGNTATGNAPPNQFYVGAGNYTISLDVVHPNGCTTTSQEIVEVYETPTAAFIPNNVCQQAEASFQDLSTSAFGDPITAWNWTFGDGASSTVQNPTHTYSASGNYVLQLIVETQHCIDTVLDTLNVEPKPIASFLPDQNAGCPDLTVLFSNTSTGAANYYWDFGDSTVSNSFNPSHSFANQQFTDTIFTTTLIAETTFGCRDTSSQDITVFGVPQANFSYNQTPSCGPVDVPFSNTSTGGVSYLWNFGDSNSSSASNPFHTYNNQSLFITNFLVELVVTSANGCTDTALDVVTVYPEPNFPFSTIPDSGCSPLTVTFPALVGAVVYDWDFGDGTTSSGQQPTHTFVNSTTNNQAYNVQLIATNSFGCSDTTYEDVIVYPAPTASFTLDTTVACSPHVSLLENTSTSADTFMWSFGDGTFLNTSVPQINHQYSNVSALSQSFVLELVAQTHQGCIDTADTLITIYPEIHYAVNQDTAGCNPVMQTWQATGTGATSFFWDFGDGSTSNLQNPHHTFVNGNINVDTNYNTILTATNAFGCSTTDTAQVTVYPVPTADFTSNLSAGCSPLNVMYTNGSTGASSFNWHFGNGQTSLSASPNSVLYTNTQQFVDTTSVSLMVSNAYGCTDSASSTVHVYPEIHYSINTDTAGCHPLARSWQATGSGASSFQWNFGDGTFDMNQNPAHTFYNTSAQNDTTYQTILNTSSIHGCTSADTAFVTVFAKPMANFSLTNNSGCTPLTEGIVNNSVGASAYAWNFGNGSSSSLFQPQSEVYVNTQSGVDTIQPELIVNNLHGCSDTISETVIVYPQVIAAITADTSGCHPFTLPFTNNTIGASSYAWNFGNGNVSNLTSPTEIFLNQGVGNQNYPTTMVATSVYGCADTAAALVTVHHKPTASVALTSSMGCSPFTVDYTNNSTAADTFTWTMGDGTSFVSALLNQTNTYVHSGTSPRNYPFELVATTIHGCSDTVSKTITVNPAIEAKFNGDSIGCSDFQVQFQNKSTGASNFYWDFGNGNSSVQPNPDETFTYSGTTFTEFTVKLVANSNFGCTDTTAKTIRVYPEANVSFTATPNTLTFPQTMVTLNNTTNGNWNWRWDYGDGSSSSLQHPNTHDFPGIGNYNITLEIDNGYCSDSKTRSISILPPPPVAAFLGSGKGCAPLTISFENKSANATNFIWEFGDGNTSTALNPTYTYYQPGTFSVKLTVVGPNGTDAVTKIDSVVVQPSANALFEAKPGMVAVPGQAVQFFNLSSNATSWSWHFGDGNTSTETQPAHYYTEPGEYLPYLVASNALNCADTFKLPFPIVARAEGKVEFPNAFTPNDMGSNGGYYIPGRMNSDIFHPVITGVEQYRLTIFNRWGEVVFETRNQSQGWDGYYNGELCQQDAYVWKAEVTFVSGEQKNFVGDVTLLR